MKILHINTFDTGGAGIAATRLHEAMLKSGVDSTLLTSNKTRKDIKQHYSYFELIPQKTSVKYFNPLFYLEKLKERFKGKYYNEVRQASKGKLEYISFLRSQYKIHDTFNFDQYDIIHLHWVADFLDWPTFFKAVKNKKIVWTLHDMAPFTGGYHYAGDYDGYKQYDQDAPFLADTKYKKIFNSELKKKIKLFDKLNLDLNIIGLSDWLSQCAQKSSLFKMHKHYNIPNTLNTDIFKVLDKEQCKRRLNLPLNKKSILFISENLDNKRKGFDLFIKAYEELKHRDDICFICVGKSTGEKKTDIVYLGGIHDQIEMAWMYNAMDLVIIPSREDNLPNTVLEALCCGVPVFGFNIGGMSDLVFSEQMGALSNDFNTLGELVSEKLNNIYDADTIRKLALKKFSNKVVLDQYFKIYNLH
jgi:glycosyltransferase involved in cell wall biosynthesis